MELPRKRLYKIFSKLEDNDKTYYVLSTNITIYLIALRGRENKSTINEIIDSGYYDYEELFPEESDLEKLKNAARLIINYDVNCINMNKPLSKRNKILYNREKCKRYRLKQKDII